MKIVRKGKEYDYDYKTIYLQGNQHRPLKELAEKHNMSIGRMIMKLIKNYEDIHNNSI
jgi:predicted DNA-binding ribbon-helix-helix protein